MADRADINDALAAKARQVRIADDVERATNVPRQRHGSAFFVADHALLSFITKAAATQRVMASFPVLYLLSAI